MEGIKKLHDTDMEASKAQDIETLIDLWTEDGVLLEPGREPVKGRAAIRAYMMGQKPEMRKFEIIEYQHDFDEVTILGDWAYEWGTFNGTYRLKTGGPVMRQRARLFRILKRHPDGSWKCSRAIWHELQATPEADPSITKQRVAPSSGKDRAANRR